MRLRRTLACAILAVCGARLLAQAQDLPAFDVASVKPIADPEHSMTEADSRPGRFVQVNVPLRGLIAQAYSVRQEDVDAPKWTSAENFAIVATTSAAADIPERRLMLRRLLAERFQLIVHVEQRQKPIYALRLARSDGQLGPGLKPPTPQCAAQAASGVLGPPVCGLKREGTHVSAGGVPLAVLCTTLSAQLGEAVVDQTGLTGRFSIEMNYAPESVRPASANNQSAPSDAPSLFTALPQQLGLKLEAARIPSDFVVVDRVERPTPD